MDKYTNEYGRTNDPETFARFASVKSYQDYLVDKNNPVVMVTLMIDGKDFLGNAHFKTYLTQRTNDHDEFTIVVRENAIDPIKRPVMEKSGDLLGESIVIKFHLADLPSVMASSSITTAYNSSLATKLKKQYLLLTVQNSLMFPLK